MEQGKATKDHFFFFKQTTLVFSFWFESSSFIANNYPSLDKKKRSHPPAKKMQDCKSSFGK